MYPAQNGEIRERKRRNKGFAKKGREGYDEERG